MSFEIFLGIDQTGAIAKHGMPQPLPTACVYREHGQWVLEGELSLPSLTKESVEALVKEIRPRLSLQNTVILLDSVLGLPKSVFPKNKSLFDLMQRAHRFSHDGKRFGAKTAHAFFAQFLEKNPEAMLLRECEKIAEASSVFALHPFQKNISCGTFRSWSELGSSPEKWFSLWPIDNPENQGPWIFEAYPSFLWKKVVKSSTRDAEVLRAFLLNQKLVKLHSSVNKSLGDVDYCDAMVLAYSGLLLHKRRALFKIPKASSLKKEGWILGI